MRSKGAAYRDKGHFMIREATFKDVPYLAQCVQKLVEHVRDRSQDAYFVELAEDYAQGLVPWVTEVVEAETGYALIAEVDQQPAGVLLGKETTPVVPITKVQKVGEVTVCWVEPEYRQQKVAQQLIDVAETWFAQRQLSYVELYYIIGNREAESTWGNLGYQPFRITARKRL